MHQNLLVNPAAVKQILVQIKPLSSMTHEVGMAAAAAELHLDVDDLESESADTDPKAAAAASRIELQA